MLESRPIIKLPPIPDEVKGNMRLYFEQMHTAITKQVKNVYIDLYHGRIITELSHGIGFNLGMAVLGTKLAQTLIPETMIIAKVKIYADTAPTGSSLIVDVNIDGTTIFTNQAKRPEIAIGEHSDDSGVPDVINLVEGNRLSIDVDQIGSSVAGGDDLLVIMIT